MSLASSHTHGNVGRTRAVLLTQKMSPITDHRLTTPSGALTGDPYPGPRSPSLASPLYKPLHIYNGLQVLSPGLRD